MGQIHYKRKIKVLKRPRLGVGYLVQTPQGINLGLYGPFYRDLALEWKKMRDKTAKVYKVYFLIKDDGYDPNRSFVYIEKTEIFEDDTKENV